MKISRKLKNILTISTGIGAASLMVIPAITLTSCSSASNSFYPTTSISFSNGTSAITDVLGLKVPNGMKLDNANGQLSWDGTFYGFNSVNQIQTMLGEVLAQNGLNTYHLSTTAEQQFQIKNGKTWYEATGFKPLPNNGEYKYVNRLPMAALNALSLYQFAQSASLTYAKTMQKALINLGVPNFQATNNFSLGKVFNGVDTNQLKQLVYGLTIGVGQAADSFFLGLSGLDMQISASNSTSFDPNVASSLTNPGTKISDITKPKDGSANEYIIDQDKVDKQTIKTITVTPTITYSWYKQLQTGGSPLGTNEVQNLLKNYAVSGKDDVYNDLGDLNSNYIVALQPITFVVRQEIVLTDVGYDENKNEAVIQKDTNAITTGVVTPIGFNVGKNKTISTSFAFGDDKTTNNKLIDFAVNAATTQMFVNTIENVKTNGNDNHDSWTLNLYKLPFYAFEQIVNIINNNTASTNGMWNENSITSSQKFNEQFDSVFNYYNDLINTNNGSNWTSLTTPPADGVEKMFKSLTIKN